MAIIKVDKHGVDVWCNEYMDKIRKTDCLCLNCSYLRSCSTAGSLYKICQDENIAMMITRCPKFLQCDSQQIGLMQLQKRVFEAKGNFIMLLRDLLEPKLAKLYDNNIVVCCNWDKAEEDSIDITVKGNDKIILDHIYEDIKDILKEIEFPSNIFYTIYIV